MCSITGMMNVVAVRFPKATLSVQIQSYLIVKLLGIEMGMEMRREMGREMEDGKLQKSFILLTHLLTTDCRFWSCFFRS